jgi:hypothetical protein
VTVRSDSIRGDRPGIVTDIVNDDPAGILL